MANDRHTVTTENTTKMLITADDLDQGNQWYDGDRENIVSRMSSSARDEAVSFIEDRMQTAVTQTEAMREKMANADKQYKGEWQSTDADDDEDIFLPKTREEINAVKAYLVSFIAQLRPIIRMRPAGTRTIWSEIEQDYTRAKLNEAMFNFYWNDVWKAVDDVMPRWMLHFLKYPMAVLKIGYYETSHSADLTLEVADRAFLYIDPRANIFSESGWLIQEYFLPKSEVFNRVDRGDWHIDKNDMATIETLDPTAMSDANLERFFGKTSTQIETIAEDEFVQCFDYWQFPRNGLGDLYATVIGGSGNSGAGEGLSGVLVRYGRNPFPYKGNPFVAASYNPDDRPDGQSLAELQEPFQKVVNTFVNLRLADVRKNIRSATAVMEQMVDDQTTQDLLDGNRIIRIAEEFGERIMNTPGMKMTDFMAPFPSGTSTGELLTQDLPFMLDQGQKSAGTPDVFRGLNAQPGATLGQVQEQLTRSSGQFTPIIRQMMRMIERVAEISTSYFRSEEFYPEDRILRIIGKNDYKNLFPNWFVADQTTAYKSVTADEMDVDIVFDAVSGADAIASKTLLMTTIERIMQSVSQIPELFAVLQKDIDFTSLFKQLINVSGYDIEGILLSDKEKAQREQENQQKLQQAQQQQKQQQLEALQMQQKMKQLEGQMQIMIENAKQQAMAQKQVAVDSSRQQLQNALDKDLSELNSDLKIDEIEAKVRLEGSTDSDQAILESELNVQEMRAEGQIEAAALARGKEVSVRDRNVDVTKNKQKES